MSGRQGATASSLTDIMASLMAVFVLLFVVAQNNRGRGVVLARDTLIRELKGQLQEAGIDSAAVDSVKNDPSTVLVILPDSVLFERGESRMSEGGRNVVKIATPLLAGVLCKPEIRASLDQMVVEGHTDNTIPYGMSLEQGRMFNLGLSQRRSMDFVLTSTAVLANQNALLECYLKLVSATGRGQEDPLPSYPSDSSPQRRVVLRLRLRTETRDSVRVMPDVIGRVNGGERATTP